MGLGSIRGTSTHRASFSNSGGGNDLLPGGGLEGSTVDGVASNSSQDAASLSKINAGPEPSKKKIATEISEYVSEESQMSFYANIHFALENIRQSLEQKKPHNKNNKRNNNNKSSEPAATPANNKAPKVESTPRVLVIGPQDSGKTSLCKVLVSYDSKRGKTPIFVNLDPLESVFCAPGALSVSAISDILDVEQGWGGSPITGPSIFHPKQPLIRFFGLDNPMKNHKYFNEIVHLLASAMEKRLKDDPRAKESGIYIDTPSALISSENKELGYSMIQHIVNEFSINVLLVVGNEKLYSDMKKIFGTMVNINRAPSNNNKTPNQKSAPSSVTVVKVPKSGGVVDRDADFLVSVQSQLINEYFYGTSKQSLSPYTVTVDYSILNIYRIAEDKLSESGGLLINPNGNKSEKNAQQPSPSKKSSGGNSSGGNTNTENQDTINEGEESKVVQKTEENSSAVGGGTDSDDSKSKPSITIQSNNNNNDGENEDGDDYYPLYDGVDNEQKSTDNIKNENKEEEEELNNDNYDVDDDGDDDETKNQYLIKLKPSSIVENGLLAVLDASVDDPIHVLARSSVLCFVHVVEADDNRKKMRILMPNHGRLPNRPFVLGDFRYHE